MPLEVQGRVLPFWKPPINISKEPDCHGCCSTLNISQGMLKIVFFLASYCKRLKTNAQNCTLACPNVFHCRNAMSVIGKIRNTIKEISPI